MASKLGKFYGIGVGVGDPENITVKAAKRLHEVDVIVLPEAKSGEGSTAFNIVKEYVKPEVEQLFLEFPMIKDVEARKVFRKNNAGKINVELENVLFVNTALEKSALTGFTAEKVFPSIWHPFSAETRVKFASRMELSKS